MIDLAYLAVCVGFFALMLGYARGCNALGRDPAAARDDGPPADRR